MMAKINLAAHAGYHIIMIELTVFATILSNTTKGQHNKRAIECFEPAPSRQNSCMCILKPQYIKWIKINLGTTSL